jgi:hypothetical protein
MHDWSVNSIFKTGKVISSKMWAYYVKKYVLAVEQSSVLLNLIDVKGLFVYLFFIFILRPWLLEMGHEQQHAWQPVATNVTRNILFLFC